MEGKGFSKGWKQAGTPGMYSENPIKSVPCGIAGLGKSHRRVGFTGLGYEGISSPLGKRDTEMNMRKGTLGLAAGEHTYPVSFLTEEVSNVSIRGLRRLATNLVGNEPCGTLSLDSWYQEQPTWSASRDLQLCNPRNTAHSGG